MRPGVPERMRAVRLRSAGGPGALALEEVETPRPSAGEALVRVEAAAITKDELDWPVDRLPATPSYELAGVVAALGPDTVGVEVGDPVYALTPFDRDGAAAEFAAVPGDVLAPRPGSLDPVESAAVPLAALTAWQGLFDHGRLEPGERVLVQGAAGGVGHFAIQLAHRRGAFVIGVASGAHAERVSSLGAQQVLDPAAGRLADVLDPVDLVFDTAGGDLLERSPALVRPGGRIVSIAEEPPKEAGIEAVYFVVEPSRDQLVELGRLADAGELRPAIDAVFPLAEARAAFERSLERGKHGKVVLRVADD